MLTNINLVKYNEQILNGRKAPEKRIGLVIIKTQKYIIIQLWPTYYIPQIQNIKSVKQHSNITFNAESS